MAFSVGKVEGVGAATGSRDFCAGRHTAGTTSLGTRLDFCSAATFVLVTGSNVAVWKNEATRRYIYIDGRIKRSPLILHSLALSKILCLSPVLSVLSPLSYFPFPSLSNLHPRALHFSSAT